MSEELQSFQIPGAGFGYTAMNVDDLAPDNTVAAGLLDESGSTTGFAKQMEKCVQAIIKSLRNSPRAENLLYRHCHFGTRFREFHGYRQLSQINPDDYDGCYQPGGATHLYDSEVNLLKATLDYCQQQTAKKYMCNGIVYIITDGCDYGSTLTEKEVTAAMQDIRSSEDCESMLVILIGVNDDPSIQAKLKQHADNCGFDQYVPLKDADEKTLAQLADFISQSISSQSQALGTGGPSQPISMTF